MENEKVLNVVNEAVEKGTNVATEVVSCPIKCAGKVIGATALITLGIAFGAKKVWNKFVAPKIKERKEKKAAKESVIDVE